MGYATLAQFEVLGLRRDVFLPRGRAVALVDVDTDTLGVGSAHGWSGSEALQFVAGPMAGVTPSLPGGLSGSVVYRPLPVEGSDSLFQVALTVGGDPVDLTSEGAGTLQVVEQLGTTIQAFLDMYSSIVDEALVNYSAAIPEPIPPILTWVVCKLAAFDMAVTQCLVTPAYFESASKMISASNDVARTQLEEWKKGKLLQTITADATPDLLENGAATIDDPSGSVPCWLYPSVDGQEAIS